MNKLYFRGSHGVVLVCDLTDKESFADLDGWLRDFTENLSGDVSDCAFILLANKSDAQSHLISEDDLNNWCARQQVFIPYYLVSSKNGDGISQAFTDLACRMIKISNDNYR